MIEWLDRIDHMRASGCTVMLIATAAGWSCTVTDPVERVSGTNVGRQPTPEEAVRLAHERWEAKAFPAGVPA